MYNNNKLMKTLPYAWPYVKHLHALIHTVITINILIYSIHTYSINMVMHTDSKLLLTCLASAKDLPVDEVVQFFH